MQVLQEISEQPAGLTLQELATRLDIPLASMHRLLSALKAERLVVRRPSSRRYVIGSAIHGLATVSATHANIADVARPHVERLRRDVSETAFVSQLLGDKVVCVGMAESTHPLRLLVRVGEEMPWHATAAARVILAYQGPAFVESALTAGRRPPCTAPAATDADPVARDLARVRHRGYETCEDEGVWAVAAPIVRPGGDVDASVSIAAPGPRLSDPDVRLDTIRTVRSVAEAISSELGGAAPGGRPGHPREAATGPAAHLRSAVPR